ncbi:NXPE family member 2-like isoform X2 [Petromyzon marinus]|nr:NXPE family member 2-like isoform X2 [Petromyzon marinus]
MNSKTFRNKIMISNKIVFITSLAAVLLIYCSAEYFKKTWNLKSIPPKAHYQKASLLPTKGKISGILTYPATKQNNNAIYNARKFVDVTAATQRRGAKLRVTQKHGYKIPISTNITCSTSAKNSRIKILNRGKPHTVGDTLHAQVEMYDFTNRRKLYGGDFLLARIFSPRLGAASSGVVTDLGNGVYDVRFTLFWPGDSSLAFTLVHASEAVSVLDRVRETVPDKVTFMGTFVSGKSSEVTQCHIFLNTAKQVCDFTDPHLHEPWMCEKPRMLPCSSLLTMKSLSKYGNVFNEEETKFFTRDRIWVTIPMSYKIHVAPSTGLLQRNTHCVMGLGNPSPAGYYFKNTWKSSYCNNAYFSSPSSVKNCLKGKQIFLLGDSTIGQWFKYLNHFTKGFKIVDRDLPGKDVQNIADDEYNITLNWFYHNYPFIATRITFKKDFRYIAQRIDNITGGSDTVIAISLGAHFTPFPLHVFQTRMHNIKAAVEKLLIRSPETKVIVKLSNVRENSGVAIFNNWNTFKLNQVLLEVFKTMNVAFIDAWDMTAVLNSAKIHPNEHIIKNQIDSFLSFIC